jgi:sugar phosphate isomerase/epimerase
MGIALRTWRTATILDRFADVPSRAESTELRSLAVTLAPLMPAAGLSPRQALERLAAVGFGHIQFSASQPGLRPRELDASARRDLLALLRRHELAPSGIDAWIPLAHFDESASVDRAVAATHGAIDLAADLGRIPVSLILPEAAEPLQSIMAHAQHHGVPLADHAMPIVAREGVGIGIDPAACLANASDPATIVTQYSGRITSARLNDLLRTGQRGPPGDSAGGRLDVTAFKIALSIARHRQPIIIDARQWSDPWAGIQAASHIWLSADAGV